MIKGTRVMVKSWPTIKNTLDLGHISEECGTLKGRKRFNFAKEMAQHCHMKTRIKEVHVDMEGGNRYCLEGCDIWWWDESWLYDMSLKRNNFDEELFTL
jgi:hypothetical protein